MMGRGKTSVIGRDSEEEKKGESSKTVTSAERLKGTKMDFSERARVGE